MKVLVIGSGGREHALIWKIAQSPLVKKLFCAPGNAGIADLAECVPISSGDLPALLDFARRQKIDLTREFMAVKALSGQVVDEAGTVLVDYQFPAEQKPNLSSRIITHWIRIFICGFLWSWPSKDCLSVAASDGSSSKLENKKTSRCSASFLNAHGKSDIGREVSMGYGEISLMSALWVT